MNQMAINYAPHNNQIGYASSMLKNNRFPVTNDRCTDYMKALQANILKNNINVFWNQVYARPNKQHAAKLNVQPINNELLLKSRLESAHVFENQSDIQLLDVAKSNLTEQSIDTITDFNQSTRKNNKNNRSLINKQYTKIRKHLLSNYASCTYKKITVNIKLYSQVVFVSTTGSFRLKTLFGVFFCKYYCWEKVNCKIFYKNDRYINHMDIVLYFNFHDF
jgi:hypothetical protein